MCVCFYFFRSTNYSTLQTLTGSPTGKFSSVTNFLELEQTQQIKGSTWQNHRPHFKQQSQVRATYTSDQLAVRSPQPHLQVWSCARTAHRTQESTWLIFLPYYKGYNPQIPDSSGKGCARDAELWSSAAVPHSQNLDMLTILKHFESQHSKFLWKFR